MLSANANDFTFRLKETEVIERKHEDAGRSRAVRDYLDSDEGRLQVSDYNLEKQFGYQHNRGKGKVTDYIRW